MVFIPFADSNVVCSKSVEAAANISHIGLRSILDKIVIKDSLRVVIESKTENHKNKSAPLEFNSPNCGSVGLTAVDYVTILVMRGRNTKIDH